MARFFHTMENFLAVFPHHGKKFSTLWKTSTILHSSFFILNFLLLSACTPAQRAETLSGRTMGTTYSIRIADAGLNRRALQDLQADINAVLAEVNRQMSTYQPDSEIARFNRAGPGEP